MTLKKKLKFYAAEGLIFIYVIFAFIILFFLAANYVENSFKTYFYLRIRFIILIVILTLTVILLLTIFLKKMKRKYGRIGLIAVYSIINAITGCCMVFSTFYYSYNFLDFFMSELLLVSIIYFTPITYVLAGIIYVVAKKRYIKKTEE